MKSLHLKGTCHIGTEKKLIVNIENYDNRKDTIDNVFSEEFSLNGLSFHSFVGGVGTVESVL